jgi:eukaryotic-like serine/threonine-protein kinase
MSEAVPSKLGEYTIERSLGKGPMGHVLYGTTGDNTYYALKVLDPERARKLDWANRLGDDINHDNLVRYVAVRTDPQGRTVMVTDYIEGRPATYVNLQGYGHSNIIKLFGEVAEALSQIHNFGYVHNNVKPTNILVRNAGGGRRQAILCDAGIDYVYAKDRYDADELRRILTHLAPERLAQLVPTTAGAPRGEPGPTSDVYSLAATLAEALTGRELFEGADGAPALLKAKLNRHYSFVAVNRPSRKLDVARLNALLERSLAFEPGGRPGIEEFRTELAAVVIEPA